MGMVVNSFHNRTKTSGINLMEKVHLSFSPALSIYNQAVLERSKPIQLFSEPNIKGKNKLNILFKLEGELDGHIICSFTLPKDISEIKKEDIVQFQSIFTESMNILLGKFLTDLEDETGIMSLISSPKLLNNLNLLDEMNKYPHSIKLKTDYELLTMSNKFDCTIYINANNKSSQNIRV